MENLANITKLEEALYSDITEFNYFSNSKNQCNIVDEKLYEIRELDRKFNGGATANNGECFSYEKILMFLNGNCSLSYDEKILLLIGAIDPNLEMYKMYKDYKEIVNTKNEQTEENDDPKETVLIENGALASISKVDEVLLAKEVSERFGIYSAYLIKYEELISLYYKHKVRDIPSTRVRLDYVAEFMNKVNNSNDSLYMDDKELVIILDAAKAYVKRYGMPCLNDLIFQLKYESLHADLNSLAKQIVFIIYVMDSKLDYLRTREKVTATESAKQDIMSACGSYNQDIMDLELRYVEDNYYIKALIS